jgi:hypothetical protein
MKQITILLFAIVLNLSLGAQSIPNGDFEHWTNFHFLEPNQWLTSNVETIHKNEWITVVPVQGISADGHGVRMMTDGENGRVLSGFVSNTDGDPIEGQGGVPYHDRPTYLIGHMRYHTLYNDTALIVVTFKKQGLIINQHIFKIHGEQTAWHPFEYLLAVSETPDTVIFAASSSNVLNEQVMQTGSYLDLDDLSFSGRFVTEQMPNSDFDLWDSRDIHHAQGWKVEGMEVDRTTDSPFGDYAVWMSSWRDIDGHVHASGIRTGYMNDFGDWYGGLPYSELLDTLRGFYKYISNGEDAGLLSLDMISDNVSLGGAYYQFYPANEWTYFEIPLHLNEQPDTLRLQLSSSSYPYDEALDGSTLIIDNLQLSSQPLLIEQAMSRSLKPAYPNPAVALIHVPIPEGFSGDVLLTMYNEAGVLVKQFNFHQASSVLRVPLEGIPSGNYVYEIQGTQWLYSGKFSKQ